MGKKCQGVSFLDKEDKQGYFVKDWATKSGDHEFKCKVCVAGTTIDVRTKGLQALIQHAATTKHRQGCGALERSQLRLRVEVNSSASSSATPSAARASAASASSSGAGPSTIKLFDARDGATRAELIWCLKMEQNHFSMASCDDIGDTFRVSLFYFHYK